MSGKNISIRMPDHVWEKIKEVGVREGRSLNNEVVHSIIEYLKKEGYALDMIENKGPAEPIKPNGEENVG